MLSNAASEEGMMMKLWIMMTLAHSIRLVKPMIKMKIWAHNGGTQVLPDLLVKKPSASQKLQQHLRRSWQPPQLERLMKTLMEKTPKKLE